MLKRTSLSFVLLMAAGLPDRVSGATVEERINDLRSPVWEVRWLAAEELGHLGDARAVEPLISCLKDHDETVREGAIEALGKLRDARALEPLTACLKDQGYARVLAAEALGNLADPRAFEPLVVHLNDHDERFRRRVVEALGKLGDARGVAPLAGCLKDQNMEVRRCAALALSALGYKPANATEKALHLIAAQSWDEVVKVGQPAAEPLVAYLESLKDEDYELRCCAAEALGHLGDPRAAERLAWCLWNPDPDVRSRAVAALAKVGTPAIKPLIEALKHDLEPGNYDSVVEALSKLGKPALEPLCGYLKDPSVRWGVTLALGKMGDPRAIEHLIPYLREGWATAWTLGQLGYKPATDEERATYLIAQGSWDEAAELGRPAVQPLIAWLNDAKWRTRRQAAEALDKLGARPATDAEKASDLIARGSWDEVVKLGKPAIEPLVTCMKTGDWEGHEKAAEALGKLGEPGIQALIECSRSAAETLVKVGKPAVEPLIARLNDPDRGIRGNAAEALGGLGDPRAVEPLIAALKDEAYVSVAIAEALGKLRDPRAVEPLIACLKRKDYLSEASAGALGKLGDRRAVEPLIAYLRDTERGLLRSPAEALGRLGDRRAVEPLIACLKEVGSEAAEALASLGDKRAIEPLVACLRHEDPEARQAAAEALDKLGYDRPTEEEEAAYLVAKQSFDKAAEWGEPAIEPLVVCLKGRSLELSRSAAAALAKVGKPALQPLIACLKEPSPHVRQSAISALEKLGDERAIPALRELLPDPDRGWRVSEALASALTKLGWNPATPAEQVHLWVCRKDGASLRANWDQTRRILLADAKSGDRRKIDNAVYAFVGIGKEEVVEGCV